MAGLSWALGFRGTIRYSCTKRLENKGYISVYMIASNNNRTMAFIYVNIFCVF